MKFSVFKFGESEKSSEISLSKEVFGVEVLNDAILEVIRWQRAKKRAGTADVKNRSEIKCSKRKIYRQKGTGGARHGARSANIFVGGGIAFGPTPRSFEFKLNKKFRKKALKSALSAKVLSDSIKIVERFDVEKISTKLLKQKLNNHATSKNEKILLIDSVLAPEFSSSSRNLVGCKILPECGVNVYDIMKYDLIIISKEAAKNMEERLNA